MNRKIVSAAVAAACAGAAAPAMALLPSDYLANTAQYLEVAISGATAQENQVTQYLRRACQPGTIDLFRNNTTANATQFLYLCTANTAVTGALGGTPAKTKLAVWKSGEGGSGNGVGPVARSQTLGFLDPAALQTAITATPALCGGTTGTTVAAIAATPPDTIGLPAYQDHNCGSNVILLTQKVPDIGVSDVEPPLFAGVFSLSTTELNNLSANTKPLAGVMYGVPVTLGLRNALQDAQLAQLPTVCNPLTATLREDERCMPSLSKAQITGIYTGALTTWDQVGLNNLLDSTVYVSRRVDTSGTQHSARVFFLNSPCVANLASFVSGTIDAAECVTPTTSAVFEGSGSSNMETCLNDHNSGGRWAVGVNSLERRQGTGWRFIKVDGQSPTLYNAAVSRYPYYMEGTMQWRGVTNPLVNNAITGNKVTFANNMATGLINPVVINELNKTFTQILSTGTPWQGGMLARPDSGAGVIPPNPVTPASILATPVNPNTKGGQNCQPPQTANTGTCTGDGC